MTSEGGLHARLKRPLPVTAEDRWPGKLYKEDADFQPRDRPEQKRSGQTERV